MQKRFLPRPRVLTALLLCFALTQPVLALDLGSLGDKAKEAAGGDSSWLGDAGALADIGKQLMSAFENNPQAKQLTETLLQKVSGGSYTDALALYDKMKSIKLTPDQLAVWNTAKNELSAFMVDKEFNYENSALSDIVSKAVSSIKSGNVEAVTQQFASLKKAANLSSSQKNMLSMVVDHLPDLTPEG